MDKSIKEFLFVSMLHILAAFSFLVVFGYLYRHSTINTYNNILLILIAVTIIILSVFVLSVAAAVLAYQRKRVNSAFAWVVKAGLNMMLPFMTFVSGFMKGSKDTIRNFYIDVNNIVVESGRKRYEPHEVMILLPHCIQKSSCVYKVTNDINNCRRCGKCCVGDIVELSRQTGVSAVIVTGGTVARNIIGSKKPAIILSVACERDLTSGISDVKQIPVIGMVNARPNGPCRDTIADVNVLKQKLEGILKE